MSCLETAIALPPLSSLNRAAVMPAYVAFTQGLTRHPDAIGWVTIHLGVGLRQNTILASDAFPPFDQLVSFLVRIATRQLPATFQLDEESRTKNWYAAPVADPQLFRFALLSEIWDRGRFAPVLIDAICQRRQFVREFYRRLIGYLETEHRPNLWRFEPLIPGGLEPLEKAMEQWDVRW